MPDQRRLGPAMLPLMLADGRLPVGGHTASGALEPALMGGLEPRDVPGFIDTRLRTAVRVEAGTAVVARHLVQHGSPLHPLQVAWAARTPSQHVRTAAQTLGRGYLRLLRRLDGDAARRALDAVDALGEPPARPVAMGAVGYALGLSPQAVATWVCYDEVAAICSAALKLIPLDPLDGVAWTVAAEPVVSAMSTELAALRRPDEVPATTAARVEQWQHEHAGTGSRLFVS
ncbi:MAG: urease accessory protein UreF [Actinomycetales bacterium]